MAICPECRAELRDDGDTCPQCGASSVPDDLVVRGDPPLEPGTMVGEYRIEGKLGAGTFGEVYAGEQPLIGKRVAVKVLNRRFASDPVMVSRFVAEARAVNRIRQRNIIDIFSFGVLPGLDRHYFVMELLDGMTLGELLARTGRLPVALALPLVRGVADALDAVHEAGITHRDLKPDNVFLARERDGSFFPKLLDFGIAKLVGTDVAHKTGSGMVLGTPRYMSPEQARGKPADHRADVYALGVIIHEMLTGAPLFVGDSAVDMLLKQAVDEPDPMSKVCADVPAALDVPVLAMLQKRPDDRPSSAGRAVAALAACAERLGIDRTTVTLAQLLDDEAPTQRAAAAAAADAADAVSASGPSAPGPKFAGTTVAVRRPRPNATDKTERAPASNPEAAHTLASAPVTMGETPMPPAADEENPASAGHSGPTTESVSTLETSSAIKRLSRARRVRFGAGAAAVVAVTGVSLWWLGRPGPEGAGPRTLGASGVTTASLPSAASGVILPAPSGSPVETEPTVRPETSPPATIAVRLSTKPADVEVWLGDRKLGTSGEPVPVPRGAGRVELRLKKAGFAEETRALTPDRDQAIDATLAPLATSPTPGTHKDPGARPSTLSGTAGKMDRILGGRE